jgi:uncharacterized protein (DUF885 family)
MHKFAPLFAGVLMMTGCGRDSASRFREMSDEFVYTAVSFSPSGATSTGLHQYSNQNLDDMLDDVTPASLDRQRQFYRQFRQRLAALGTSGLDAEDLADMGIIQDQISLALLDLDEIHSALHNPTIYVETLGNAIFSPYVLEYAPKDQRLRHIISRLQKTPAYLNQARKNLESSPEVWTSVAIEENDGNIGLVEQTIRKEVPAALRVAYDAAAEPALDAMRQFQVYLKNDLAHRNQADWRLGKDWYTRKFRHTLQTGTEPEATLAEAERRLDEVRAKMLEVALPLDRTMYAAHHDHTELSGDERENKVIGEVLDKLAERHSTPASYMGDAQADLAEARTFVQEKHLLTLPARSNLQVIPTPEFMRGSYPVGGFSPAPALDPQLSAFYWITPVPPDWPKGRVESKLREYNFYKLKLLTIHEAIPGHYVQGEFANDVQPKSRRVLRSVFGNGPYVEGWAQYATQMMLDEGFMNRSPELALTFAKEELRVIANAIIDIRLQAMNMSDQEALDLMEKQTFQEKQEAEPKLQRAKLTSCQLPMYFLGWRGWLRVRDDYREAAAASYSLAGFNDKALQQGAVPLASLGKLLR